LLDCGRAKQAGPTSWRSDCSGQLAECRRESTLGGLVGGDLVVPAAQVLDEPVTGGEYPKPGLSLLASRHASPALLPADFRPARLSRSAQVQRR
jgi:hypothetical protein